MKAYPVPGPRSTIECPVHRTSVAVDDAGRLASTCPRCRREARNATRRLERRTQRRERVR